MNKRSLVFFDTFAEVALRADGVGVPILLIVFWIIGVDEGDDILGVNVGPLSVVALTLLEGNVGLSDNALFEIVGVRDVTKVPVVELHAVSIKEIAKTCMNNISDTRLFCFKRSQP
jgi:hypothetical protein